MLCSYPKNTETTLNTTPNQALQDCRSSSSAAANHLPCQSMLLKTASMSQMTTTAGLYVMRMANLLIGLHLHLHHLQRSLTMKFQHGLPLQVSLMCRGEVTCHEAREHHNLSLVFPLQVALTCLGGVTAQGSGGHHHPFGLLEVADLEAEHHSAPRGV